MSKEKAKRKILIIEDDEYVSELLTYLLQQNEANETLVVADGRKALETVEEEVPDIIFLDFMLPGMDGMEICRRLKKNEKTRPVPIVLMSSSLRLNEIKKEEIGADYVIAKPFNMTDILNIIDSLKVRG